MSPVSAFFAGACVASAIWFAAITIIGYLTDGGRIR